MTRMADMKMALLAALIMLTTVICSRDENTLVKVEPALVQPPVIETQALAG